MENDAPPPPGARMGGGAARGLLAGSLLAAGPHAPLADKLSGRVDAMVVRIFCPWVGGLPARTSVTPGPMQTGDARINATTNEGWGIYSLFGTRVVSSCSNIGRS